MVCFKANKSKLEKSVTQGSVLYSSANNKKIERIKKTNNAMCNALQPIKCVLQSHCRVEHIARKTKKIMISEQYFSSVKMCCSKTDARV